MATPDIPNYHADIDPTRDQVRALRNTGREGPIVMLNLLKFHDVANYPEGHPDAGISGKEAYARYQHAFTETVGQVSKAEVVYEGPAEQCFIGMAGTQATDWDKVLLVRYPSRHNFLAMMADDS